MIRMHKWQAEGVDPDKPGPHWANKYDARTIGNASDFLEQYMRRVDLRAFWPMEWRLVAQWAAAFATIEREAESLFDQSCSSHIHMVQAQAASAGQGMLAALGHVEDAMDCDTD